MTFTIGDTSLTDKENLKFIGGATGSDTYLNIGSQANLYIVLTALQSGTSNIIPVICNSAGMLLTSGI